MVCEKNSGTEHDFLTDPIEIIQKDDMLYANGTTLGADNGIAVAMMLAILDSSDIAHPRIECLFTTQEEVGLNGAQALEPSSLDGKILINLDSEEYGNFLVCHILTITATNKCYNQQYIYKEFIFKHNI